MLNNNNLANTAIAQEYDKYGDSSYSQYPTDDKKYECRTGPFEGFFVSSVEFCKHVKFIQENHSRDIIETERKVPKAHQVHKVHKVHKGQLAKSNFTNTYHVIGNRTTITSETPTRTFSFTSCDPGDIVLEGGGGVGAFLDGGLSNVFLLFREPVNEGNGYR